MALTSEQVAARLQVSTRTIHRLATTGKLKGFKVGTLWRFNETDVDDFARPAEPMRRPATQRERIARLMRVS
jgi:excisionase family DNA binding protein